MKKTKFSDKQLKTFKKIIKSHIKDQKAQLATTNGLLKDHKKYQKRIKNDMDTDASIIRNKEMLKSMKSRSLKKIDKLEQALVRIKKGTYGRCIKTGNMISKRRLYVIPEARTCIKMK